MDYIVEYEHIDFRVSYTYDSERPEVIVFAAQPYEMLDYDEGENLPSGFLIYGRMDYTMTMEVGFHAFTFVMTDQLHERIGELYKLFRAEFAVRYSKGKKGLPLK